MHPRAVRAGVGWGPAHLHLAEHPLGVGHHGGEAPVGSGHRRQATWAAIGVERVLLGARPRAVDKAHGLVHPRQIAAQCKVGIALTVGNRNRQAQTGHALEEQTR